MITPSKVQVRKNIKALRKKHSLTQERLAEIANLEYKYVQKIEGKNPPNISLKVIDKLAKALKTSAASLLK